jgi:hypothetical protein
MVSVKRDIGLHAMCCLLSDFDQIWNVFNKFTEISIPNITQIHSLVLESLRMNGRTEGRSKGRMDGRTDEQTDRLTDWLTYRQTFSERNELILCNFFFLRMSEELWERHVRTGPHIYMQQPTESKHNCCEQNSFTRRAVRRAAKQWKQWQRLITLRHTRAKTSYTVHVCLSSESPAYHTVSGICSIILFHLLNLWSLSSPSPVSETTLFAGSHASLGCPSDKNSINPLKTKRACFI